MTTVVPTRHNVLFSDTPAVRKTFRGVLLLLLVVRDNGLLKLAAYISITVTCTSRPKVTREHY